MSSRPACTLGAPLVRAITVALAVAATHGFASAGTRSLQQLPARPAPDARMYEAGHWVRYDASSGLPSVDVHEIVETTDRRVWAVTAAGLAVYDGFRWRAMDPASGLPAGRPLHLIAGDSGRVFVNMGAGMFVGDEAGFEEVTLPAGAKRITDAVVTAEGDVILQVEEEDVPNVWTWRLLSNPDVPIREPSSPYPGMLEAGALGNDSWSVTGAGLQRWDKTGWAFVAPVPEGVRPYRFAVQSRERLGFFYAERPLQTRGLWEWAPDGSCHPVRIGDERLLRVDVGADGDAFAFYRNGLIVTRHAGSWAEINPLPREMFGVNAIRSRARGELWSATEGGLFLYRPIHPYWSTVELGAGRGNIVLEMLPARSGDTWLGTGAGLARLSPDGSVERIGEIDGRVLAAVTGVAEDAHGHLWIGSGSGSFAGVWRLAGGVWEHFGLDAGFPVLAVHKIRVDRRGRPWFLGIAPDSGGDEPGAFVRTPDGFEHWGTDKGLGGDRVYDFVDTGDAYWFATLAGISRWRRGAWKHWTVADGLAVARVGVLAADADGRMWFGHGRSGSGFGLGVIDDEEVRYVGAGDGGRDVSFLAFDEDRLWIGSETHGLSEYTDGTWTVYGLSKGLSNRRLTALGLHDDGLLVGSLFGGLDILERDPVGFRVPLVLFDEPVIDGARAHLRWRVATHWQTADPDEVQVRLRVDGGDWSAWGKTRELSTQTLDYGEHEIELEVRDFFGRAVAALDPPAFRIPTPLHRQVRFFLPIGAGILLLAVACTVLFLRSRREGAALRESEERFRQLAANIREVFWLTDWKTSRVLYVSPAYESAWGLSARELVEHSSGWGDTIHEEDRARVLDRFSHAGEGLFDEEYRIVLSDGSVRWVHDRAYPIRDMSGEVYRLAGVTEDVTEEHRTTERQHLLTRELDHRVKNNLAGVIALAQQTIARSEDMAAFDRAFTGRLHAMARTHEALAAASWDGLSLGEILLSVLGPFATAGAKTVTLEGPELIVGASAAMPLCGALHELATNAAKHGALQVAGGHVSVVWREVGHSIQLRWAETGGPVVGALHRSGTGTNLVHGLVEYELSGSVDFQLRAEGLMCTLDLPAAILREPGPSAESRSAGPRRQPATHEPPRASSASASS